MHREQQANAYAQFYQQHLARVQAVVNQIRCSSGPRSLSTCSPACGMRVAATPPVTAISVNSSRPRVSATSRLGWCRVCSATSAWSRSSLHSLMYISPPAAALNRASLQLQWRIQHRDAQASLEQRWSRGRASTPSRRFTMATCMGSRTTTTTRRTTSWRSRPSRSCIRNSSRIWTSMRRSPKL